MKTSFKAKDIQNLLIIQKHRYEYIATKIGIKPDVNEVEGTGHSHLYSFKNLLQFAYVHQANKLGLTPKAAKKMLAHIDDFEKSQKTGIYNPNKIQDLKIHYIDLAILRFFVISDSEKIIKSFFPKEDQKFVQALYNNQKAPKPGYQEFMELFKKFFELKKGSEINRAFSLASGYVTVNLHNIKSTLIAQLSNYKKA